MSKSSERIKKLEIQSLANLLGLIEKNKLNEAIVYNYDSVEVGSSSDIDLDLENIMEARFFSEKQEIRIFSEDGAISGILFEEAEQEDFLDTKFLLYPRGSKNEYPASIRARKYIDYDEDNQAYISYMKPSKLVYGEEI